MHDRTKSPSRTKALVTGGCGFIGSHVTELLVERGARVYVLDDLSTGGIHNLDSIVDHSRLEIRNSTIEDCDDLDQLVSQSDLVFHFAAAVGVKYVLERRVNAIATNLRSTTAMIEAASRSSVPLFLASSSEVYGCSDSIPFQESHPIQIGSPDNGRWGYAASKAIGEFVALAHASERGLPVVIGRLFNTSGPRQSAEYGMVLPRFVNQAREGTPITVYGDGAQTRCFAHVSDVSRAIVDLMLHPAARGQVFNIGSDEEISISDLAHRVKSISATTSPVVFKSYDEVYGGFADMRRRVPDLAKITETIEWERKFGLDDIIQSLLETTDRAGSKT